MLLDAEILSEEQLNELDNSAIRNMYHRIPFVYAHGKLEEDLGTDIIYLFLGSYHLNNGLIAYTSDFKPVKFHLYRHPRTFELTGIVAYISDRESSLYGAKLVIERPERF